MGIGALPAPPRTSSLVDPGGVTVGGNATPSTSIPVANEPTVISALHWIWSRLIHHKYCLETSQNPALEKINSKSCIETNQTPYLGKLSAEIEEGFSKSKEAFNSEKWHACSQIQMVCNFWLSYLCMKRAKRNDCKEKKIERYDDQLYLPYSCGPFMVDSGFFHAIWAACKMGDTRRRELNV